MKTLKYKVSFLLLFLLFSTFSYADNEPNNDCSNVEVIEELNNISTTTSHTESGVVNKNTDRYDYYQFSVNSDGDINIDFITNKTWNSLRIGSTCGGTRYYVNTYNDNTKYPPVFQVNSGDTIYIQVERRYTTNMYYNIDIEFTATSPALPTPPIMGNIPDQLALNGIAYSLDISSYVTLTDGDAIISYTLTGTLPIGLSFNTSTGILDGIPTVDGVFNLSVFATDDDGDSNSDNFTLTVDPQTPPIMADIPDQLALNGTAYSLDISAYVTLTDGDAIISYTLTGTLPTGLSFNTSTGILAGTTILDGVYNLSVIATDDDGDSNSDSFTLTVNNLVESNGGRDFEQRIQYNIFGDVKAIGNTVLCILNSGQCVEPTNSDSNADTPLDKAPQSYSTLDIPPTATVEYARIYWQGRQKANADSTWYAAAKTAAGKIQLKKGTTGTFVELTADVQDFDLVNSRENIRIYSASADASSIVDGKGTYYVDTTSFYTNTGETGAQSPDDGLGNYGAWMLVIVYSDPDETQAKNVTVFDGYKKVESGNPDVAVSVSGFLTPRSGTVDSKTYVFTAEGDKYLTRTGDVIQMAGATYNTSLTTLGTFDSRIDVPATRNPSLSNNNGIDIHLYDTGTTSGALNIISTNETGATFNFTSDQDTYFPSVVVFSTELYLPKMCYDYSIKQDGSYLNVDRDAYPIAHLDSTISSSDLEITVYLKNMEADFAAEGIAIKSDVNVSKFTHSSNIYTSNINGTTLIDRGTPTSSSPLCDYDKNGNNLVSNSGCSDGHNIRKGNGTLDIDDYVYTKFSLTPLNLSGLVNVDEPLGLSLKYYITADGNKIEYPDYELGSINVPLCPPTASYQPTWGQFNVIHSGNTVNNIYTQISRNPFNASVIFDSIPSTGTNDAPLSDINTTILVEIIDIDSFGDINASCGNPDSALSTPIFVPIEFTPLNFQTALASQPADYYNFAVKNASFRIWYFADDNGTLVQNWTATLDTNNTNASAISGLYQAGLHTACSTECSIDTSTTCFNCIRANYAKPICSRDNFSIRPESYDVKIYDINHTASITLKDLTKFNISNQDGFDPTSAQTFNRMNLAAAYNYRYDINATGYDGIDMTPGYTRYFNGGPDYNATMIWDPQTAGLNCNDDTNQTLIFYTQNGTMLNNEQSHSNVGQYRINIIDQSWTAVDWSNNTHHIAANNFEIISDCQVGLTTSTALNNRYGCTISTDHGSDNFGNYYQDHDVEFFPYWFDMTGIVISHGINNNTTFDNNTFLYMTDMMFNLNQDQNMSLHLNGSITALGEDNSTLSNFVNNCYAKPVDLTINKSSVPISTTADNIFIFHNTDIPANDQNGSMNDLNNTFSLNTSDFNQSNNGTVNTILNLNFERNASNAQNPETLTFLNYNTTCTNPANNCQMNADLNTEFQTEGNKDLNQSIPNNNTKITINYLYGRSHATHNQYVTPLDQEALIYYEVYCNGTIDNNTCDKTLLQNGADSNSTDDPRWFINLEHNSTYGTAGNVNQKGATTAVTQNTPPTGNHPDSVRLNYDESRGYPYKTTMEMNSSPWLIYNKYDDTTDVNEFAVEFRNSTDNWAGISETNTTTRDDQTTKRINRRTMW